MHPFKVTFTLCGIVYATIGFWAVLGGFSASAAISVAGLALCYAGWSLSDRYL